MALVLFLSLNPATAFLTLLLQIIGLILTFKNRKNSSKPLLSASVPPNGIPLLLVFVILASI